MFRYLTVTVLAKEKTPSTRLERGGNFVSDHHIHMSIRVILWLHDLEIFFFIAIQSETKNVFCMDNYYQSQKRFTRITRFHFFLLLKFVYTHTYTFKTRCAISRTKVVLSLFRSILYIYLRATDMSFEKHRKVVSPYIATLFVFLHRIATCQLVSRYSFSGLNDNLSVFRMV